MRRDDVIVYATPELLAAASAARLITTLVDAQASRGAASAVLTGGQIGIELLREVRRSPTRDAVDWSRVDLYWGDERFLPAGHPERNETQARDALLDHVPVDPARVYPMASSDGGFGDDVEAAAAGYAALVGGVLAQVDVLLLGMGDDGHTASVFAAAPAAREVERTVVAVRDSPKPPPTRITLTLPAIRTAPEVWLVVSGAAKAGVVAEALDGADPVRIPAAGAAGRVRTRWLLDHDAAHHTA